MVKIITDSAADFEAEELQALDVACIPLSVTFGEREYQENVDLTKAQFYSLLDSEPTFPKTSQPSPMTLERYLRAAQASGQEAVVITLSSALSGTYQGAVLAKERLGYDRCLIFDSLMATAGQRILVEQAVKLRDQGASAREIVEELHALRPRMTLYGCIYTLEFLRRGGRISGTAAALGAMANIKPIITVTKDGRIEIPAKVLGRQHGMRYLLKEFAAAPPDPDYPIYVMYAHVRENTELLAGELRALGYDIQEKDFKNVGAAIGSHIGHNGFGYVYIAK